VIAFEEVAARRAPLALSLVSLEWGPGVHAVVGGRRDGGPLLLALIAGAARPRSGRVIALEGTPSEAGVRRRVGYVPIAPALPDSMRVDEMLATAAAIRGEPAQTAEARLSILGIEAVARRAASTLSLEEARAVAVAEAVTSAVVRVLLLEEPLMSMDPRATTRLPEVLRARAREGWAVVVATASWQDASELADDHLLLQAGVVVGHHASLDGLAGVPPGGPARVRMVVSDPRALVARLAHEDGVDAVARRDTSVVAKGRNSVELARAAGRAVLSSGVELIEMRMEPAPLDDTRGSELASPGGRAP
jgi:ABC-2 type transport system ATP-binding protein